ncbi:hypothetical protein ACH4C6_21605 [Streptomyces sp. NPDC017943]|uniref:hypothetical protein n=1 Tax=Streptomyces sp. NPDC017943 TaxID=3365019 RepID=UPI003795C700
MALSIGELVGFIRADDSGFTRGMEAARLRMRGLQRDVDGRLRDIRGRFVSEGEAAGRGLADGIRAHAEMAAPAVRRVGLAVGAIGVGLPAVAAVGAALGGLAAGAAAAGIAVKAFSLAAGQQWTAVQDVATLAEEAQKAAASGAADAAEKQKAYTDALAQLPPATQETAKAFIGLKSDFKAWSDGLSGTTMPVFTKGIQILRDLLPSLTPFVKAAADAFGGFLDEVGAGVRSAGFKQWAADMAAAAGPALRDFLQVIKNLAIGFGGLLQAFLPASEGMTGGLVSLTQRFAEWGQSLQGSEGFAQFLALAKQGAQTLGTLAQAVLKLIAALGPFIGIAATVALHLAEIVNALPPDVLNVLAGAVLSAVVAFKAFRAASSVVDTASTLMNSRLGTVARRWVSTASTAVASGARIAASATANAARTAAAWTGAALRGMARFAAQMIRTAAVAVANFARMAARAVIWAATMAAQWLIAMGPVGWIIAIVVGLVALIIANWDTIKAYTMIAWNWIVAQVKGAVNGILAGIQWLAQIPGKIGAWFGQAKDWAVRKALELVSWMTGLPGRVGSAIAGLAGTLRSIASNAFNRFRQVAAEKAVAFVSLVRSIPGRARSALGNLGGLLLGAGRALIQGFINGIKGMIGSVRNAASSVVKAARNFFPFSPAKEGPFSGKGYTLHSGRALAQDFGRGISEQLPYVRRVMDSMPGLPVPDMAVPGLGLGAVPGGLAPAAARPAPVVLEVREGSGNRVEAMLTQIIRESVAVRGGGDVQKAFGRGRRP